jgi:hypothetical protein
VIGHGLVEIQALPNHDPATTNPAIGAVHAP